MSITVNTAKVYEKAFSVREKYEDGQMSGAVNFTLKMRIPDTLTGDDLAQHIMSEIVIRQANKTRKAGWGKFKAYPKVVEVTLNKPGTRTLSEGLTPEKFAAMSPKERKAELLKLARAAGGYKEDEINEMFEDDEEDVTEEPGTEEEK